MLGVLYSILLWYGESYKEAWSGIVETGSSRDLVIFSIVIAAILIFMANRILSGKDIWRKISAGLFVALMLFSVFVIVFSFKTYYKYGYHLYGDSLTFGVILLLISGLFFWYLGFNKKVLEYFGK